MYIVKYTYEVILKKGSFSASVRATFVYAYCGTFYMFYRLFDTYAPEVWLRLL